MATTETGVEITEDYHKMKVTELRKLLKERALPTTGSKDELVERLKHANEAAEKLLDESVEEHSTEAEAGSIDEDLENEIMNEEKVTTSVSPPGSGVKRKLTENGDSEPPPKKSEVEVEGIEAVEGGEVGESETKDKDESENASSRVIKLSSTKTKEELLEMRAKKFGVDAGDKKALRAKRFGIEAAKTATTTVTSGDAKLKGAATEVLKKRAERFGITGPTEQNKITITVGGVKSVDDEKKKKRAERFGITNVPQIDINKKVQVDKANPILSKTLDQRKQLRANRFRTS